MEREYIQKIECQFPLGLPELIRCKDCKHYDSETQSCLDGLDGIFQPEWFCADGERKDGDGE